MTRRRPSWKCKGCTEHKLLIIIIIIIMGSIETPPFQPEYDVLVIGCGLSGIYTVYRMRQLGLRVKALDAGSGEGGTWRS